MSLIAASPSGGEMPDAKGTRVVFYIQHLLGIGHLKRAATLVRAMVEAHFDVTVVSGGMPVPGLDTGAARFVQLPPTRATDVYFKVLVDADDEPIDEAWKTQRRKLLCATLEQYQPEIVITELFPFGRRQLRFELLPFLEAAKRMPKPPLIVTSVRDILVQSPKPERTTQMLQWVRDYYDAVLVHGDPALIPFEQTFPHAAEITDLVHYTGYVVDRSRGRGASPERDAVLVSAGGGAVSEPLLNAALEARANGALRDQTWRFLIGHSLHESAFQAFSARGASLPGVVVERARPDFVALLQGAVLSISQGGYNTVMEVLDAGARAVVVPYAGGLETEQTLRAQLLAQRGVLTVVEEAALSAETLANAVDEAMSRVPTSMASLDTGGAETTVALLRQWSCER
jgi:predicted glycosyltransferase